MHRSQPLDDLAGGGTVASVAGAAFRCRRMLPVAGSSALTTAGRSSCRLGFLRVGSLPTPPGADAMPGHPSSSRLMPARRNSGSVLRRRLRISGPIRSARSASAGRPDPTDRPPSASTDRDRSGSAPRSCRRGPETPPGRCGRARQVAQPAPSPPLPCSSPRPGGERAGGMSRSASPLALAARSTSSAQGRSGTTRPGVGGAVSAVLGIHANPGGRSTIRPFTPHAPSPVPRALLRCWRPMNGSYGSPA